MKRLLSAILTLALVLSLIPAVFAEDVAPKEQLFDFMDSGNANHTFFINETKVGESQYADFVEYKVIDGVKYYINPKFTDYNGGRIWKIFEVPDTMVKAAANTLNIGWYSQGGFVLSCASTKLNCNDPVSIAIEPQDTGFYVPEMYVYTGSMTAGTFGLWLTRGEQGKTLTTDYMNDNNKVAAAQKNFGASMWIYNGTKIIYTTKGEDIIAALDPNNRNFRLNHIKLIPVNNPLFEIEANDSKENIILDVESNAEVSITSTTVSGTADINKYEGTNVNYVETAISMPVAGGFVEYKSSDENVAIVDETGKITAVGGGKTKIYAQSPDGIVKSNEIEITVTAPSTEDEALTNAFEVNKEELKEYVAPSVVSISAGGSVITPEKNADDSYDIEAAEENKDGAKFLYWAKGLKANKKIVSFSNKLENYIPEEDGADWLIAVYDDMLPSTNEYYNANGQLLAMGTEPSKPSMAGYGEADAWKQYGETNIYVAEYSGKTQPDNVEVTVNGEKKTVPYGTEITCTATEENFKCWTKSNINGNTEIVSAEQVYTFKAWENCEVNAVNEEHTYTGDKFKIVIDSFIAGNETGIMAEFIGFGSNVIEKGIMWGSNKIAMTKSGTQFSVIADKNGEYKGYAIVGNQADGYTLITDGSVTVNDAE